WQPMLPKADVSYHSCCGSRVRHAVTTNAMSRCLLQRAGCCGSSRSGRGIEEGWMGEQHLPKRSRPHRQVQTLFEPSHAAQQSLAEAYVRLVPWRWRQGECLPTPASATGPNQASQARLERKERVQCS